MEELYSIFYNLFQRMLILDGDLFEDFDIFQTIGIMLYSDEIELCNPIGSSKKKHKLVMFYYTLINMYQWWRSHSDNIQLLLIVRSSDFKMNLKNILQLFVEEIKKVKQFSWKIGQRDYCFRVCLIYGDNLGSRSIGGFSEKIFKQCYLQLLSISIRIRWQLE